MNINSNNDQYIKLVFSTTGVDAEAAQTQKYKKRSSYIRVRAWVPENVVAPGNTTTAELANISAPTSRGLHWVSSCGDNSDNDPNISTASDPAACSALPHFCTYCSQTWFLCNKMVSKPAARRNLIIDLFSVAIGAAMVTALQLAGPLNPACLCMRTARCTPCTPGNSAESVKSATMYGLGRIRVIPSLSW